MQNKYISKQSGKLLVYFNAKNIECFDFQFIYHNSKHYFGTKKIWIDNFNKVICSDLEKTIIDCLFKPDYAGGITEIARAIYISRHDIKYDNLLAYIKKFNSQPIGC
jgi:predicted transcriptional regulator of viral defense system